jgi:vesicle coat complex subunit
MTLLQLATASFNPDVRDRAYIYWRLLSTDPDMAKALICEYHSGTSVSKDIHLWETKDLITALENMGSISNLMHKLPHQLYKNVPPSTKMYY